MTLSPCKQSAATELLYRGVKVCVSVCFDTIGVNYILGKLTNLNFALYATVGKAIV